ncbi:Arm DNA-binding domain-containing protein [Desulfofundulus sp. TPOSR]|uniref:Arm DNA-binding domain-containing protein n=1 Tax=Desulfofundulus sp. TPOSR TaxID=2714340 RepID=UPI001FAE58D1|nr:Arm DNA-binding domain-containing protein [Desulfofundulus sp. TPOSR]
MPGHPERRSDKSWTIIIELGRDPVTGKRKRFKRAFRGTKKEAEKELARLLAKSRKVLTWNQPNLLLASISSAG